MTDEILDYIKLLKIQEKAITDVLMKTPIKKIESLYGELAFIELEGIRKDLASAFSLMTV